MYKRQIPCRGYELQPSREGTEAAFPLKVPQSGDAPEESDKPCVHDALVKEQEQEPEVAADRYRQQNVCHADWAPLKAGL